jgi:hypothetical protein
MNTRVGASSGCPGELNTSFTIGGTPPEFRASGSEFWVEH